MYSFWTRVKFLREKDVQNEQSVGEYDTLIIDLLCPFPLATS